jgi:hypothetical protein
MAWGTNQDIGSVLTVRAKTIVVHTAEGSNQKVSTKGDFLVLDAGDGGDAT